MMCPICKLDGKENKLKWHGYHINCGWMAHYSGDCFYCKECGYKKWYGTLPRKGWRGGVLDDMREITRL